MFIRDTDSYVYVLKSSIKTPSVRKHMLRYRSGRIRDGWIKLTRGRFSKSISLDTIRPQKTREKIKTSTNEDTVPSWLIKVRKVSGNKDISKRDAWKLFTNDNLLEPRKPKKSGPKSSRRKKMKFSDLVKQRDE